MSKKILIIDDEPDIVKVIAFRLESLGYEIMRAGNGNEAIEAVKSQLPDLILLDYYLPDCKGTEIMKQIKELEGGGAIPIIFMSASANKIQQISKEAGAVEAIEKPIEAKLLTEIIEKYI